MEQDKAYPERNKDNPTIHKRPRVAINSFKVKWGVGIASFVVFLLIWQVLADLTNPTVIAGPISVVQALISLSYGNLPPGSAGLVPLGVAMIATIEIIVPAFLLTFIAIPLGIAMGRWKVAESIIDPWINAIYAVPMVALIPVLYFAMGTNYFADVFVAFVIAVFTVLVNTYTAAKYTSNTLAEVGRSFGANERQFLLKIVLPASLPQIVAGLRLGLGRVLLGAFVAEAILSTNYLGMMMFAFNDYSYTNYSMAVVVVIAIMGILVLQTPKLLERRLFKWKESETISRGR